MSVDEKLRTLHNPRHAIRCTPVLMAGGLTPHTDPMQDPMDEAPTPEKPRPPEVESSQRAANIPSGAPNPERPSHWLSRYTLEERRQDALGQVPKAVRDLALHAACRWNLGPAPILASLLHLAATALEARHRLKQEPSGVACPFNLILVSETIGRQDWVEFLGEPWLAQCRFRIRWHQQLNPPPQVTRKIPKRRAKGSTFEPLPPYDEWREANEKERDPWFFAPCRIERSPLAKRLVRALAKSWGRSVLSLNSGVDPLVELRLQGRRPIMELCQLLEMSWKDLDLPCTGAVPERGVIHLLWQSDAAAAREICFGLQSEWKSSPPPVLLMRSGNVPGYLPSLHVEIYLPWAELMEDVMTRGEKLGRVAKLWSTTPQVDFNLEKFSEHLLSEPGGLAPFSAKHFQWGQGLVIRLAMLLDAIERPEEETITLDALRRAGFLTFWLLHEHHECLRWLKMEHHPHEASAAHVESLDWEDAKEAILDRLVAKGTLSRREMSRSFHRMPAKVRDRAIAQLKRQGLVVETPEGDVALTSHANPP